MTEEHVASERESAISELSGEFGALFTRVRRIFRDAADLVSPGLQPVAYQALSRICRADGITVGALAEAMDTDKSVASRAVRELENLGLIERRPDPSDGRSAILAPSALGRERLNAARDPMRASFDAVLSEWKIDDVRALTGLLRALTSAGA